MRGERDGFTAVVGALPTAALLHTLAVVMSAFAGRIWGGVSAVGLTYVLYPLCMAAAVGWRMRTLGRRQPEQPLRRKEAESTAPSSGLISYNLFCVAVCAFFSMGAGWYNRYLEPLFYADTLTATLAAVAYPWLAGLGDYLRQVRSRLINPAEARTIRRAGSRLLLWVCVILAAAALSARGYLSLRARMSYSNYVAVDEWMPDPFPSEDAADDADTNPTEADADPEEALAVDYVVLEAAEIPSWLNARTGWLLAAALALLVGVAAAVRYGRLRKKETAPESAVLTGERIRRPPGRRKRRAGYWDGDARVRRLFYKKVQAHIKTGLRVKPSHTSAEIACCVAAAGREDISVLEALYRRARYGRAKQRGT